MTNCSYSPLQAPKPAIYVTNAVVIPLLFGVGVLGNLVIIVLLNRSYMRVQSAIYVYLTGVAVLDLFTLLLVAPGCLHDMGVLSSELGYSKLMARYESLRYGLGNMLKHATWWTVAFVALVRYVKCACPGRRLRWTKISASRIVQFLVCLLCIVLDCPRFFERKLQLITGHCFERLELWTWQFTDFARQPIFLAVYPWLVLTAGFALPALGILVCTALIAVRINLWGILRRGRRASTLSKEEVSTSLMVVAVICTFVVLEIPESVGYILVDMWKLAPQSASFRSFLFAAHCLSLVHSSINFVIFCLLSEDFRKTFRRTFCCSCIIGDDYYEPIRCPEWCCCGNGEHSDGEDEDGNHNSSKRQKKPAKKSEPGVMWI